MNGLIYKTIFPNGKIYIGQSIKNNPNYFGSGVKCLNAIKKFGTKNLRKVILKSNIKSQKKLDTWEFLLIKKFNSTNPEKGYNILTGTANNFGSGSPMLIPEIAGKVRKSLKKSFLENPELSKNISKRQKEHFKNKYNRLKLSNIMKGKGAGKNNPNYGNNWNEEQKENMRDKMIGRYDGENNPNYGNKWTKEQREKYSKKIKDKRKGKNNGMYGKKRITNGLENKTINENDKLPDGFRYGLTRGLK